MSFGECGVCKQQLTSQYDFGVIDLFRHNTWVGCQTSGCIGRVCHKCIFDTLHVGTSVMCTVCYSTITIDAITSKTPALLSKDLQDAVKHYYQHRNPTSSSPSSAFVDDVPLKKLILATPHFDIIDFVPDD